MPIEYKDSYVKMDEEYGDQIYKLFGPSWLGIPVGTDLEYADEITLAKALEARVEL